MECTQCLRLADTYFCPGCVQEKIRQGRASIEKAAQAHSSTQLELERRLQALNGVYVRERRMRSMYQRIENAREALVRLRKDVETRKAAVEKQQQENEERRVRVERAVVARQGMQREEKHAHRTALEAEQPHFKLSMSNLQRSCAVKVKALRSLLPIYPSPRTKGTLCVFFDHLQVRDTALTEGLEKEEEAAVLGYVALVVSLLARHTASPLPYPVAYFGSRSSVSDPSARHSLLDDRPAIYPLYREGVDGEAFARALELLNLDVLALCTMQGVYVSRPQTPCLLLSLHALLATPFSLGPHFIDLPTLHLQRMERRKVEAEETVEGTAGPKVEETAAPAPVERPLYFAQESVEDDFVRLTMVETEEHEMGVRRMGSFQIHEAYYS